MSKASLRRCRRNQAELLSDAQLFRQLHTADALTSRLKQVHGVQPLVQGNVGAFKDSASPDRELLAALFVVALVVVGILHASRFLALAVRAHNAIFPAFGLYRVNGRLLVRKPIEELESADCAAVLVAHPLDSLCLVSYH